MATWRNGHPPVRFDDPVHHVMPKHNFVLHPFSGQPKKYREPRRLPGCQVRESGIPRAGNGLWTAERVRKEIVYVQPCHDPTILCLVNHAML